MKGENESEQISKEIDLVIDHEIPIISRSRPIPFTPEDQRFIIASLRETPNRTYLWLHLVLDVLRKSLDSTKPQLQWLIKTLPASAEDAYEKILCRIDTSKSAEQARRLLHIIVGAVSLLSPEEVNIMLVIDEKTRRGEPCPSYADFDLQPIKPFEQKIKNICGLFLSIIDGRVHLLHFTAKEFLILHDGADRPRYSDSHQPELWRHSLEPAQSHLILTKICLAYFLLRGLDTKAGFRHPSNDEPFLVSTYAAANWPVCFRQAKVSKQISLIQPALDVCNSNRFRKWFSVYLNAYKNLTGWSHRATQLILGSFFGLEAVIEYLLDGSNAGLNLEDEYGMTALLWEHLGNTSRQS